MVPKLYGGSEVVPKSLKSGFYLPKKVGNPDPLPPLTLLSLPLFSLNSHPPPLLASYNKSMIHEEYIISMINFRI